MEERAGKIMNGEDYYSQKEEALLQNKNIDVWSAIIENELAKKYNSVYIYGEKHYLKDNGKLFRLDGFIAPLYGFILVISDSIEAAERCDEVDICRLPILDYDTPEDILREILIEVE